jgi:hypothetical protein
MPEILLRVILDLLQAMPDRTTLAYGYLYSSVDAYFDDDPIWQYAPTDYFFESKHSFLFESTMLFKVKGANFLVQKIYREFEPRTI